MPQTTATNPIRHYTWTRLRGRPMLADRMFYGWMMIPVAMAAMICTAPAQTYGVSVFTPHLRAALSLNHAQLALAYAAGTFLAALPLTWFGKLMDRYGIRITMTAIVILATGASWFMSQVQGLVTVFLGFLLLRMFGQSALMLLTANVLPQWFNRRLGLATGIFSLAPAAAIATVPTIAVGLIDAVGWRGAYLVLGLSVSLIMLPLLALVFRNRPEDIGQRTDGIGASFDPEQGAPGVIERGADTNPAEGPSDAQTQREAQSEAKLEQTFTLHEAVRTRAYWIMVIDTAYGALAKTAIAYSAVSVFISRQWDQGQAAAQAATMFTVFGITLGISRLVAGYLADRVPLNMLLLAATTFAATLMFCFWHAQTTWMIGLCGALMGLQQGCKGAVGSTMFRRYYGRAHLGRIKGSFMTCVVGASALGPILVDGLYDWVGSYEPILAVLALISLPLMVAAPFATRPT